MSELTAERLRALLQYDQESGVFTRRVATGRHGRHKSGIVVGALCKGYVRVSVDGREYAAHRLAWLYVNGEWPDRLVDHIDTVPHHNWIGNLRLATQSQNLQNRSGLNSNNTSGFRGVHWDGRRWRARLTINRKTVRLGEFPRKEDAIAAVIAGRSKHHPFSSEANHQ